MDLNTYQMEALKTAIYPQDYAILYPTLGLAGESGEVAEKVKKLIRDDNFNISHEKKEELKKELGDVLWYIATLSADLGLTLQEVAETNIAKLKSRQERNVLSGSGDNR